jgi:hypothetical protein
MPVWVPDAAHEALRDLVRARGTAKKDQLRHRRRLGKLVLRHGKRPTGAGEPWTKKYLNRIRIHAQRGRDRQSGSAHLRRVLVESTWAYRHRPNVQGRVLRRQKARALSEEARQIAWKAQQRLYKRFLSLDGSRKNQRSGRDGTYS